MEEEQASEEKPAPAKKGPPTIVLLLGAVVATGASAAAGAVLGPSLAGKKNSEAAAHSAAIAAAAASGEDAPPGDAAALEPIIVDVRDATGELHHLKVSLAIELGHGVTEEEFKKLIPRIRDAAISYLRGLPFDQVTTPAKFDPIRTELGERIAHAAGKERVRRVLFTDFVAQ
jgi:flagellar basal body-associated protein FliL